MKRSWDAGMRGRWEYDEPFGRELRVERLSRSEFGKGTKHGVDGRRNRLKWEVGMRKSENGKKKEDWEKIDDAFSYASDKDVIIVLSAGNHAQEVNDYPGNESTTIIAGASLLNDERWEEEIKMMKQKIKMGSC